MQADTPGDTLILGGGLAGIAAALRLSYAGQRVTLIESRKRLGGRATSFPDRATGHLLDNCQHVVMKCCTNLLHLYRTLGVEDRIQWHDRFHFVDAQGRFDELTGDDLPAPLHMTRSLMAFQTLSWREKINIAQGMQGLMKTDRSQWTDRSFAQWLAEHRQMASVIEKFWQPVVVGAINETPVRMAASAALQVFQEGFLAHPQAYWMGLSTVPLVQLYDKALQVIEAAGGRVMLSTNAQSLVFEQGRINAVRIDGDELLTADHFISAMPFDRLARIAPPELVQADPRLAHLQEFEVSPIIGIHLWVAGDEAEPLFPLPHLSFMQSPLHWIFNKGHDAQVGGQHLHGVISAAHEAAGLSSSALVQMAMRELAVAFPRMGDARVVHSQVIKEQRATFSLQPGVDAIRPGPTGSVRNLYLAGDWCATGWPATMEGAVRSGYLAAAAVLDRVGKPQTNNGLIADLPASGLYEFVSRG